MGVPGITVSKHPTVFVLQIMTEPSRILVWFRSDLRVNDHAALSAAARVGPKRGVLAVFTICPAQWAEHDWSGAKVEFVRRTLGELSRALWTINVPLLIRQVPRFSDVARDLVGLARENSCDAIYFNDEYEINERKRDDAVAAACGAAGIVTRRFTDNVLVEPGRVRTGEGRFFTVFTPFKRALYKLLEVEPVRTYPRPSKQAATGITAPPIPESVDGFATRVDSSLWPAGEAVALSRLKLFVKEHLHQYKSHRDFPALDATSSLSPYLCVGAISPRQCATAALESNNGRLDSGSEGAQCWISEIVWREFYKHILVGFPRVCMHRAFKSDTERIRWSEDHEHFERWCEGRTGIPIVDAAMRQLLATGWMHNRCRMIVAMYLSKDLFVDWRKGERHFMRHLVDGDLAANNGGWQWSASTGTDAAPYFRIFNPVTQSRRFDPEGAFIRRYVPELAGLEGGEDGKGPVHDPAELPPLTRSRIAYPEPMVDREKARARVMKAFGGMAG